MCYALSSFQVNCEQDSGPIFKKLRIKSNGPSKLDNPAALAIFWAPVQDKKKPKKKTKERKKTPNVEK